MLCYLLLFALSCCVGLSQLKESPIYEKPQMIFKGGTEGYQSFRIPSIIKTKKDTLLAICEGRVFGPQDYGEIHLVSRRSLDNGTTWGPLQVVYGKGNDTWGNPTTVVNQIDGKIWLFLSWNDGEHSEHGGNGTIPITKHGERKVWSMYSTYVQDGTEWSAPVDMTDTLQPLSFVWDAIGPGIGIQKLHPPYVNRLIIPATERNIYSDDNGVTWHYSMLPPGTSEGTIVEKLNGVLIRNDRATDPKSPPYRMVSTGNIANWTTPFTSDKELPDPHCQGSTLRYNESPPNRIYFMNMNSTTQRDFPVIRITYDEMESWQIARAIPQNGSGKLGGYSSLVKTADMMTGALIEYNENNAGKESHISIQFHKFNLAWILNGHNEPTRFYR